MIRYDPAADAARKKAGMMPGPSPVPGLGTFPRQLPPTEPGDGALATPFIGTDSYVPPSVTMGTPGGHPAPSPLSPVASAPQGSPKEEPSPWIASGQTPGGIRMPQTGGFNPSMPVQPSPWIASGQTPGGIPMPQTGGFDPSMEKEGSVRRNPFWRPRRLQSYPKPGGLSAPVFPDDGRRY